MLEKFIDSQIVLSMGFSSKVITYVLVNIMIGKKKGRRIFLLCCIIHYLTYNVGLLVIFDFFFGSELWFRLLMPTVSLVLGIGVPVIMSIVWKINFSKMMLGFLIPDSLSLLVYIPAQLTGNPVMVILFSITALIFICIFFSRFFEKYQPGNQTHMADFRADINNTGKRMDYEYFICVGRRRNRSGINLFYGIISSISYFIFYFCRKYPLCISRKTKTKNAPA